MHALLVLSSLVFLSSAAFGQASIKTPAFQVASVKPSQQRVGADNNNQFVFSPVGITGRNVTLRRLIAEAYHLQLNQVLGPSSLDQNEYDIEAKSESSAVKEQLPLMLQTLLAERFNLKLHGETRSMRLYQLITDRAGPKIRPIKDGEVPRPATGFHFRGDMRQLADLLAFQLTIPEPKDATQPSIAVGPPIPVLDKTGLAGIYDFNVDMRLEFGTDAFTVWRRILQEQLGLRIESSRGDVTVVVVDDAVQIPTAN